MLQLRPSKVLAAQPDYAACFTCTFRRPAKRTPSTSFCPTPLEVLQIGLLWLHASTHATLLAGGGGGYYMLIMTDQNRLQLCMLQTSMAAVTVCSRLQMLKFSCHVSGSVLHPVCLCVWLFHVA